MLDLKWIREKPEELRAMLARRHAKFDIEALLALEAERRKILAELEKLQAERNRSAEQIGKLKAQKADVAPVLKEVEGLKGKIKELEAQAADVQPRLDDLLLRLPNSPHPSVPEGASAEDNKMLRQVGQVTPLTFKPKNHAELGEALGIIDFKTGTKLSGARFPVLRGAGAALERALIQFMLDLHIKEHGYTEVMTPYLVSPLSMQGTGQLPKFEEELFRCERDSLYLIPTAEVPVTNMHRDDTFEEKDLPRKYVAYTPCFRREAGSYGKDTAGLIRNHQFNKVELVQFVKPEDSLETLELLTASAEKVLYKLRIPYRVMALSAGDLGFASAKTYDIEVWMPGGNEWREISSCSVFTDFQARRMNIKFKRADGKREFVHTLNGSGVAIGRTMAVLLETYQQPDGSVLIPDALKPYLPFSAITASGGVA